MQLKYNDEKVMSQMVTGQEKKKGFEYKVYKSVINRNEMLCFDPVTDVSNDGLCPNF